MQKVIWRKKITLRRLKWFGKLASQPENYVRLGNVDYYLRKKPNE